RPGRIAYQLPCHLRAQNMGTKSADVLRLTGATVTVIERCSAVEGPWEFKREYSGLSMQVAVQLFREVGAAAPGRRATARSPVGSPGAGRATLLACVPAPRPIYWLNPTAFPRGEPPS